jgi:hypothetical protein
MLLLFPFVKRVCVRLTSRDHLESLRLRRRRWLDRLARLGINLDLLGLLLGLGIGLEQLGHLILAQHVLVEGRQESVVDQHVGDRRP